ncbi:MAG: hypothetical protein MUF54_18740 [Polyangiaceae bacterium]|jgi:formate C-acetyltransferase|nr:hypothetical protein [Polyangiaceae bacterium]
MAQAIPTSRIWSTAASLAPRVRKLRDEHWSFFSRSHTNDTLAFSTGTWWDTVCSNAGCLVNGPARRGPAAIIKSVDHRGLESAPGGASHTMSFHPTLLSTPARRNKLKALLRACGRVGGTCLQVSLLDAAAPLEAQQHPHEYGNLLVRVTGYKACFARLGKEIQDEIIVRESHRL